MISTSLGLILGSFATAPVAGQCSSNTPYNTKSLRLEVEGKELAMTHETTNPAFAERTEATLNVKTLKISVTGMLAVLIPKQYL